MRVGRLEASRDEAWMPSRWGYALAGSTDEALELARRTSGLPYNRVHEKHPKTLWPGVPGKTLEWDR